MKKSLPNLLDGYADLDDLAKTFRRHPRSIRRWTMEPDGLPFVKVGNQVFIHVETARAWMLSRMQKPNARRNRAA
jgi:hypothetical protein